MTWAMRPLTKTISCASEPRRDALKERTRERVPVAWADTQNNLGLALGRLGERERGTAQLKEAVAVFREALQERTRGDAAATNEYIRKRLDGGGKLAIVVTVRGRNLPIRSASVRFASQNGSDLGIGHFVWLLPHLCSLRSIHSPASLACAVVAATMAVGWLNSLATSYASANCARSCSIVTPTAVSWAWTFLACSSSTRS
jgi:hypothetical protein